LQFGRELRVDALDFFLSGLQGFFEGLNGRGTDFGFAEGDVEGRYGGAVGAQGIE
jgi:hypothetical protein